MRLNWLIIGSSAAASLALSGADLDVATDCLKGLEPALVTGGFSGSVDCQRDALSVTKIGEVLTQWHTFSVYSYRFKLAPVCRECAIHGGQRIIFMEKGRYVGQYRSDFATVTIEDGKLFLEAPTEESVPFEFTPEGPPNELLVDSELIAFFR